VSLETVLVALARTVCPRVSPDAAVSSADVPYITYVHVGGQALRYVDNTASDKRHAVMQLTVWHTTRAACLDLIRQLEEVLCGTTAFVAEPQGEIVGQAEPDLKLYGISQDFSIVAAR
jgi:hypothetical protein